MIDPPGHRQQLENLGTPLVFPWLRSVEAVSDDRAPALLLGRDNQCFADPDARPEQPVRAMVRISGKDVVQSMTSESLLLAARSGAVALRRSRLSRQLPELLQLLLPQRLELLRPFRKRCGKVP